MKHWLIINDDEYIVLYIVMNSFYLVNYTNI